MFIIAKKVAKKIHKNRLFVLIDIIICGLKYGAGYYDYQEFEFYNLNSKQRKTYLTRNKNNLIIQKYNNKDFFYILDQKDIFNQKFNDYLKRDYLIIDENKKEDFIKFTNKYKELIAKPINGEGGKGISKIILDKTSNLDEIFKNLITNNQLLIEECIKQNDKVSKIYSNSVNTLRLFTFYDGKESHIVNNIFKIGNGGVTDNFSSGSMYTFIDENGTVITPGIDREDNYFNYHPITKEKIVGYQIPFYKEACKMVIEASKLIKEIKYIGWDVAITKDGPAIIEGNSYPGIFQMKASFTKNKEGLIPKYQKYMDI